MIIAFETCCKFVNQLLRKGVVRRQTVINVSCNDRPEA